MAKLALAMFKSDGTRRDFPLAKDRIVIGRKVNCDLRIPLTAVSRQHCEVTVDNGKVRVKDLGSSNGTYHNSVRVQEAHLAAGDELVVGPVVFTLIVDGQPSDLKPVRTIVKTDSAEREQAAAKTAKPAKSAKPGKAAAPAEFSAKGSDELPEVIPGDGAEGSSIQMDDDPITALESLASGGGEDSGDFDDIDFFLDDDDEDR